MTMSAAPLAAARVTTSDEGVAPPIVTVAPEWQGRGHGSALLDVVADHGRDRGLATLWLEVRQSNHRARALYARRGFAEVGVRRGYYPAAGGREDAVVMRLALAGGGPHAVV